MRSLAASLPRRRPVAQTRIDVVDGGLWQASCVCRWRGRRIPDPAAAQLEAGEHAAACGMCQRLGRDYMQQCSCANCQRRRILRAPRGE